MPSTLLICPLDNEPLTLQAKQWQCPHGHCFDVARQGYVNLLPVQHKKAKDPGDSKEMVLARRDFLALGHYQPIAQALADAITPHDMPLQCLDAGCGEGYYLRELSRLTAGSLSLIGMDISKWAVLEAAKQNKQITWVVDTNAHIPMQTSSLDYVFCLFGFPVYEEFARVLKPNGKLIMIDPTPEHLLSLRKALYTNVNNASSAPYQAPDNFVLVEEKKIQHEFSLTDSHAIEQLILMTPHWFRAQPELRDKLIASGQLSTQLSVTVKTLQKTA